MNFNKTFPVKNNLQDGNKTDLKLNLPTLREQKTPLQTKIFFIEKNFMDFWRETNLEVLKIH